MYYTKEELDNIIESKTLTDFLLNANLKETSSNKYFNTLFDELESYRKELIEELNNKDIIHEKYYSDLLKLKISNIKKVSKYISTIIDIRRFDKSNDYNKVFANINMSITVKDGNAYVVLNKFFLKVDMIAEKLFNIAKRLDKVNNSSNVSLSSTLYNLHFAISGISVDSFDSSDMGNFIKAKTPLKVEKISKRKVKISFSISESIDIRLVDKLVRILEGNGVKVNSIEYNIMRLK